MTTTKKGYELYHKLVQATQFVPANNSDTKAILEECSTICRHTQTLHRLAEMSCNGYHDPKEEERADKREAKLCLNLSMRFLTLSASMGVMMTPYFQGDPRGPAVLVKLPDELKRHHDHPEGIIIP